MSDAPVRFERRTQPPSAPATLIEGLPGHGLVAAIAVDLVTRQLDLEHHGSLVSERFPSVSSFENGRVRDPVRVYAGEEPPLLTLQSDIAFPEDAYDALARGVVEEVGAAIERVVFLVGAPAESQAQIGAVSGIATTDGIAEDLRAAGVDLAAGNGLVGGATGALLTACYHRGVPAAALVVRANPYIPDPRAAQAVIEDALEPLVAFDIDTAELDEEAHEIEARLQQIAQQYRAAQTGEEQPEDSLRPSSLSSMYQ